MTPDSQPPADAVAAALASAGPRKSELLAPWWHTVLLLFILLFASVTGTRGKHPFSSPSRLPIYLWSMTWEWLLVGFTWLGIRKRRSLRDVIGGRWPNLEAFLFDVMIAAIFWLASALVLGAVGILMHLDRTGKLEELRRSLGFLIPQSRLELCAWVAVSTSAGICEEILFRGYLQQQFGAMTRSSLVGVLLSAVVFGAAHGYEGAARMILIGIFGFLFGVLAWWRKSLRPGMMAHAWHDAISGALLRMMK